MSFPYFGMSSFLTRDCKRLERSHDLLVFINKCLWDSDFFSKTAKFCIEISNDV